MKNSMIRVNRKQPKIRTQNPKSAAQHRANSKRIHQNLKAGR